MNTTASQACELLLTAIDAVADKAKVPSERVKVSYSLKFGWEVTIDLGEIRGRRSPTVFAQGMSLSHLSEAIDDAVKDAESWSNFIKHEAEQKAAKKAAKKG